MQDDSNDLFANMPSEPARQPAAPEEKTARAPAPVPESHPAPAQAQAEGSGGYDASAIRVLEGLEPDTVTTLTGVLAELSGSTLIYIGRSGAFYDTLSPNLLHLERTHCAPPDEIEKPKA